MQYMNLQSSDEKERSVRDMGFHSLCISWEM